MAVRNNIGGEVMSGFGIALFTAMFMTLILHGYGEEQRVISEEDDLELERQLRITNKHALKTIQNKYGDIIDCVDIYKQLAFDHPLLKNHKIQKRPSSPLQKVKNEVASLAKPASLFMGIECPYGSIPIRRTTKADLMRHKHLNVPSINPQKTNGVNAHFSLLKVTPYAMQGVDNFKGAKANIGAYRPTPVEDGQASGAQIWVEAGPNGDVNSIQAGWVVDASLYGDNLARFVTYWTRDGYKKTGCFNILCPGFVHVDKRVYLGSPLSNTSVVNGVQYVLMTYIYQDNATGNWWLVATNENIHVGYWPKELFSYLAYGASYLAFGGRAHGKVNESSPPMGSGLRPDGNYRHACFFAEVQWLNKWNNLIYPLKEGTQTYNDKPNCYGLDNHGLQRYLGYTFLFGGPGGKCGN